MKLALIGLGPHGLRLLEAAKRIGDVTTVAVIDRDEQKLNLPQVANIAHKLSDLSALWTNQIRPDILLIATNGPSHAPIALEAMDNGVTYLLISKPLACSAEDGIKIIEKAKEKNVRVVVDHALRYDDTYDWIHKQLRSGIWGDLKSVYIQRPGIGLGCLGVHSFDLANYLLNSLPETVTGWVDEPKGKNPRGEQFIDPGGLVILNYSNERRAVISQIETGAGPMSVELICTFARIKVDEKYGQLEVVTKEKGFVPGPGKPVPMTKTFNPHQKEVKHDNVLLMERTIRELIGNEKLNADAQVGLNSVAILAASYLSHQHGNIPYAFPLYKTEDLKLFLPVT